MKYSLALAILAVSVSGCAQFEPSVPAGYTGPQAKIEDTMKWYSNSHTDMFFLTRVDGKKIEDARSRTVHANMGMGFHMDPITLTNPIPARPVVLTLEARTMYAAPVLELTHTIYHVTGDVSFTPEANKSYFIKGQLGENYSAVWLEDSDTHAVIGKKVEVNGSAKLGILEK